ncbi:hypothetical protein XENTR_v10003451, partial [Xenopus tropicalis]
AGGIGEVLPDVAPPTSRLPCSVQHHCVQVGNALLFCDHSEPHGVGLYPLAHLAHSHLPLGDALCAQADQALLDAGYHLYSDYSRHQVFLPVRLLPMDLHRVPEHERRQTFPPAQHYRHREERRLRALRPHPAPRFVLTQIYTEVPWALGPQR